MSDAEVDAAVLKVLRTLYSFSNNDRLAAERRILWRAAFAEGVRAGEKPTGESA